MTEGLQNEIESQTGQEGSVMRQVARTYAEALMNVAEKREQVDSIATQLESLIGSVFKAEAKIEALFSSPIIKRGVKEPILQKVFQGRASDLFYDFLLVLNRHNRLDLIREVATVYRQLLDLRGKRIRVLVRSATPLAEDQQRTLEETLRASLKLDPVLQVKVDPDLLGGMIVQVGDEVYDSSVRTRIEKLRNQLLSRSNHEIQSRRNRSGS